MPAPHYAPLPAHDAPEHDAAVEHAPSAAESQRLVDPPSPSADSPPESPLSPKPLDIDVGQTAAVLVPANADTEDAVLHSRTVSGKDGVFSNLSAKPEVVPPPPATPPAAEMPPSYDVAVSDPAPAYYDHILFTTQTDDGEILIEGLPVGSTLTFMMSMMVSMSFQFVGFLMTYLLAVSHAGRAGAKAGFGITMLQYGIFLKSRVMAIEHEGSPFADDDFAASLPPGTTPQQAENILDRTELVSYLLMVVGWFMLVKSVFEYLRAKKLQAVILATPEAVIV